ncbi:sulfite reductase [NADPH] flavoprotein component, partial [Teratosphaeriaceae sp. CCFEE 6253]
MRLQTSEGSGPNGVLQNGADEQPYKQKSSALPFGQDISLSSVSGPTYLTAQTLVQQVAYALSNKIFSYSPETFDLDIAARAWETAQEKNALGEITGVQRMETRVGAGSIALGYMFSPDFDLSKRNVPQSIVASAASLQHLRPALDQLSLLYDVANPTALQVAAVDFAAETKTGLVSDYCSALTLAEELGMGLVSSKSAYEVQHMSLLSTLLASVVPSMHVYDGITVGRETTRVVDVLDVKSLKRTYDAVLATIKEDLPSKRLTAEGKLSKLMLAFNAELGTEYKCFEYYGHQSPTSVMVVFGTVEASLSAQVAEALAQQGVRIGVVSVRVYRPFAEEEFMEILAPSVEQITVLGQVKDAAGVIDGSIASSLYADVVAAVSFQSASPGGEPAMYDIKYARETVWTVARMDALLRQLNSKSGESPKEQPAPLRLTSPETKQYTFWDSAASGSAEAPLMLGQLLSDDSSLNVATRSGQDNLVQGGVLRTDLKCSPKSIEAAYSVKEADVVIVAEEKLLKDYSVLASLKEEGTLLLRSPNWRDDEIEKKLSTPVRKAIAARKLGLYVLDPAASTKASEEPALESYLLQLAFLKIAQPEVYDKGLKKLQAGGDALEGLAADLDTALKRIEVPESWLTVEPEENESVPPPEDLNVNSFTAYEREDMEPPTYLRNWVTAAKGLSFKEACGTATALRPDLGIKTSVIHLKEHRRLTPPDYDRNIFHIEFDLGDSGLKYEIGEALGIHAENDKTEVEEFIKWYGLQHDDIVEVPSREDPDVLENRT